MSTHAKTYDSEGNKFCNNCQVYHSPTMFGKNRVAKDGLSWSCSWSLKNATNERRISGLKKYASLKQMRLMSMTTDEAVKILKTFHPSFKLANPYQYQMPDAWEQHKQTLNNYL